MTIYHVHRQGNELFILRDSRVVAKFWPPCAVEHVRQFLERQPDVTHIVYQNITDLNITPKRAKRKAKP